MVHPPGQPRGGAEAVPERDAHPAACLPAQATGITVIVSGLQPRGGRQLGPPAQPAGAALQRGRGQQLPGAGAGLHAHFDQRTVLLVRAALGGISAARGSRQAQAQRPGQRRAAAMALQVQLHVAGAAVFVSAGVHRHVARRGAGHQRAVHGVCHVRGHQHQRVLPAQAHHQLEHRHAHGHAGGQRGAGCAGAAGGRGLGVVQAAAAVLPAAAPAFAAQAQAQHPLARPRCAMGAHHTGGCRGGVGVVGVGVRWRAGAQGLEGHAQAGLRRPVLQVGPAAFTAPAPLEAA